MSILKLEGLSKRYEGFELKSVGFSLKEGEITGFIGRNGAGKSTTLKSILGFVCPDSGEVEFFGKSFKENEFEIKQKVGFVAGGVDYYSNKTLKAITRITKRFYSEWDDEAYYGYLKKWGLDENKTPAKLSAGMRVKYSLALALSHNARLLILDEPTSGLDPVSRGELLEMFLGFKDSGVTILFSTHITSDLDSCADNIIYIKDGGIIADMPIDEFVGSYRLGFCNEDNFSAESETKIIGKRRSKNGYSFLVKEENSNLFDEVKKPTLEEIMVHIEKENEI